MTDTVIVTEGNGGEVATENTAEDAVEAIAEVAETALVVAATPEPESPPPASQGEYALSAAMLAAIARMEDASNRICEAADRLSAATVVTAEIAETLAEVAETEAEQQVEEEAIIEEITEDVPPSNRRMRARSWWDGDKKR